MYNQKETLVDIFNSKGLTHAEVARRAGISAGTLYNMRKNPTGVTIVTQIKVCNVLEISVEWLQDHVRGETENE